MFFTAPRDRSSPTLAKINAFTCIYIPVILYFAHISGQLFNLGKYENVYVVFILTTAEIFKYYLYRTRVLNVEKPKRKTFRVEKIFKSLFISCLVLGAYYVAAVLLGAPFLSNVEETFMFATILTVLSVFPLCLYLEIDNIHQLLNVITSQPSDMITNMLVLQLQLTVFGAWLGAVTIPLDWDRLWQIWPTPCVLGSFAGYFLFNFISYFVQTSDVFYKPRKRQSFNCDL